MMSAVATVGSASGRPVVVSVSTAHVVLSGDSLSTLNSEQARELSEALAWSADLLEGKT
jgi:hypothetical protein